MTKEITTIDKYIKTAPREARSILQKIRDIIRKETPDAKETISYRMPTFKLSDKNLVHFAAFKNHIGFYPTPSAITQFKKELSKYKTAKGSVQFPLDEPIPYSLIKKMVAFRVKEQRNNK